MPHFPEWQLKLKFTALTSVETTGSGFAEGKEVTGGFHAGSYH
jgi:hypothetical protein